MAFLPLESTVLTMAGPPVATSMRILGWLIMALVFSIEGADTVTTRLAGAPALQRALLMS